MSTFPIPSPSKSWWSRSKSTKDVSSTRPNPSNMPLPPELKTFPTIKHSKSRDNMAASKLNNLVATAMGKRSKKPTLTIQDPPPHMLSPPPLSASSSFGHSMPSTAATSPADPSSPFFTNRPPAKSVSSTVRSYEYDDRSDPHTISEPRTPSDHPRDRRSYQNSLLTLSDPDPFAAGSVILPHFMQDPNRLSVWSDSSLLDPHGMKRPDPMQVNRMSYGSSSSNSHSAHNDAYSLRSQTSPSVSRAPSNSATGAKRNRRETYILPDGSVDDVPDLDVPRDVSDRFLSESESSCLTVQPRQRILSAAPAPRAAMLPPRPEAPPLRPRGMTVAAERSMRPTVNTALPRGTTAPLRLARKPSASGHSHSQSPSTASTSSPILFSARSSVSNSIVGAQPAASPSRPLVLVRKASSSRVNLPPLSIQPPSKQLPPTPLSPVPLSDDVDDGESLVFPDPPSPDSESMSFVSLDDFPTADEIHHFMHDTSERVNAMTFSRPPATHTFDAGFSPSRSSVEQLAYSTSTSQVNLVSPKSSLRKVISQQSVSAKRVSQASITSAQTSLDDHGSIGPATNGKAPRKQRSFHHPRISLPTLRHSNSYNSSCAPPEPTSAARPPSSGAGSPQPRRRLFSGSSYRRGSLSKGSSSPPPTADDELRSVFSLSLDGGDSASREPVAQSQRQPPVMMSFANMGNQLSLVTDNACIAPMWEELTASSNASSGPSKRMSQSDYIPQQIMSPADMLRLEEELAGEAACRERQLEKAKPECEPGDFGLAYMNGGNGGSSSRSRASSIVSSTSAATMAFGEKRGEEEAPSPSFTKLPIGRSTGLAPRRPSTAAETTRPGTSGSVSPIRPSTRARSGTTSSRPATAQASLASAPTSPVSFNPPSPNYPSTALPPPPRARVGRAHARQESDANANKRVSVVPMQPLSPPPRRRPSRPTTTVEPEDEPAPTPSRPPSAFNQRALKRRSVMRKPSFLEIEDDYDAEMDPETITLADMRDTRVAVAEPIEMESSFLDLDRGDSFDTVRSFEDGGSFHAF